MNTYSVLPFVCAERQSQIEYSNPAFELQAYRYVEKGVMEYQGDIKFYCFSEGDAKPNQNQVKRCLHAEK